MTIDEFESLPANTRISLRRFGVRTRLNVSDVTLVAATNTPILGNNPDRLGLLISNTSATNAATITQDGSGTATQGDVVGANGGAYGLDALNDGEAAGRAVFGISTGGATLHVEEVIGYGPVITLPPGVTPL